MNSNNQANNVLMIVGDKFATFGTIEGVVTVSQLAKRLEGRDQSVDIPHRVIVGQGVSESWILYLKARAQTNDIAIRFIGEEDVVGRTGRSFAHKHNRSNILITDPLPVDDQVYRMKMCIDDDCEVMSDHTTGYHIQGMLLIEAARQAFLAVTEWYLLPSNKSYYFVINNFDVAYKKFAFPVSTVIDFKILTSDVSRNDRVSVTAIINFAQGGESVCEVNVGYTAILSEKLQKREESMANDAVASCLKRIVNLDQKELA